jgi:hypothetical protein
MGSQCTQTCPQEKRHSPAYPEEKEKEPRCQDEVTTSEKEEESQCQDQVIASEKEKSTENSFNLQENVSKNISSSSDTLFLFSSSGCCSQSTCPQNQSPREIRHTTKFTVYVQPRIGSI